jgi:hypothetical protein
MFEPNPFGKEGTVNIIETRPRNVRILPNARAICIRPDPKDPKAKPRVDDIDAFIARLPPHTVELIDIHYDSLLPRLPRLDGQGNIRFAHIGARKLRDYSPLFGLTRLESLFLVSFSLPDLSAFQTRQLKYLRLIRGRLTHLDLSATAAFLQHCQSHSRVLPASGFGVAYHGGRASAVATAGARTTAKLPCSPRMQVIGVFGDYRHAPGQDRFPGARRDAELEVGILDRWRRACIRALQSIAACHGDERFGLFSSEQVPAVRTILSRNGSGEVCFARVIAVGIDRGRKSSQRSALKARARSMTSRGDA